MPTRTNRYYNNPQIAQIASNLSGLFAPPSMGDVAALEQASALGAENRRLSQLWNEAKTFDERGAAVGQWNPSQGYEAFRADDAIDMRGQDITAATSRANNAETARHRLYGDIATTTLNPGQTAPGMSVFEDELAAELGLRPGATLEGREAPLSMDEVLAQTLQAMDPEERRGIALSDADIMQIIGEDGQPTNVLPQDALGQTPYSDPGGRAAQRLFQWEDPVTGQTGTVTFDPNGGGMTPVQGGTAPPPTAQFFEPGDLTGTREDLGLGAPARNNIDRQVLAIDSTLQTLGDLQTLISQNPSSQGAVGSIRKTFQDLAQTGNELAQSFGGEVDRINQVIQGGAADPDVVAAFDPSLPAIDVMANVLAFKYAKTLNDDRLSNEMLLQARRALGLDRLTSNQADSLARLGQVAQTLEADRQRLLETRSGGLQGAGAGAAPPAAPPAHTGPVQIQSPEEWSALPPGTEYIDPQGNRRVKGQ